MKIAGTSLKKSYGREFYDAQSRRSYRAAQLILPYVLHAIGRPSSVLDLGCGIGTWLRAVRDHVPDAELLGVDHPDVPPDLLMISRKEFVGTDLTQEIELGKKFDLAMSLEVAEHLDKSSAEILIDNLVRHSGIVLFSSAIPGQGGTNHVNENWPDYWIDLFLSRGFICNDIIRPKIWTNSEIPFWYRQNIMLFTRSHLPLDTDHASFEGASLVHPELFEIVLNRQVGGRKALAALKAAVRRRLRI